MDSAGASRVYGAPEFLKDIARFNSFMNLEFLSLRGE